MFEDYIDISQIFPKFGIKIKEYHRINHEQLKCVVTS